MFPAVPQYPLAWEAEDGIYPVVLSLKGQGVLIPARSLCNTNISPVKKEGKFDEQGRKIWGLPKICEKSMLLLSWVTVVPNPATIPTPIPAEATCFAVIDPCSATFSIHIYLSSEFLFAFVYQWQQYTWTRLPPGYCESPTRFSQCLKQDLDSVTLRSASVLIQYVGNLLVPSSSLEACQEDTLHLLCALANKWHKASQEKLQFCKQEIEYLGHTISAGKCQLTDSRISAVSSIQPNSALSWGKLVAGCAVCSQFKILKMFSFPTVLSAQPTELVALTEACTLTLGKSVNVYTDSQYAFNVCHSTGQIWKHWGFITSSGACFSYGLLILELLYAIMLSTTISVMHCSSHIGALDEVSLGNACADAAAKWAALEGSPATF